MKRFKITAFWQAVLVILSAYLIFDNAFPPVMPRSLLIQYMAITIMALLLYYSYDDSRWEEFKQPLHDILHSDDKGMVRWTLLLALSSLTAYLVYAQVKTDFSAPVELRQAHPAPPSTLEVYGKKFNLSKLENPLRTSVLKTMKHDPQAAWATYQDAVKAGQEIYFQNCFYCHGDLLDGEGPYARGFNPLPANFQDVGTIAQLQEAFLFWRISTGGPGLPKEGAPWNSAMPVWHEMLSEDDIWNTITFLYDYVGQVPRLWDQEISKQVTGMKDQIATKRANLQGEALYQFRCAACHGEQGMGDGPAADFVYPRPRDFSLGLYKYKTTPGTMPPSDADLIDTIAKGLPGTAMPGWKGLLSNQQIQSLLPVIKKLDTTYSFAPEEADDELFDDDGHYLGSDLLQFTATEPLQGQIPYDDQSLARGRQVFEKVCSECHGKMGRGNITSGKKLTDDWGYRLWPRDLSKPWTWRYSTVDPDVDAAREKTIQKIYQRLSIGILGTPMPAHRATEQGNQDPISLEDRWHVANYVYSLREQHATQPGETNVIKGLKIQGALPDTVDDEVWNKATASELLLVPNVIKGERLFTPLNDSISVKALFNQQEIAFLLEINDRTRSVPGDEYFSSLQDSALELYPDALAIQLPKQDAYSTTNVVEKPLYRHGDKGHPTTMWYWNAGAVEPPRAATAMLLDATGSDNKLSPRMGDKTLTATGKWQSGQWKVLMKRPMAGGDSGDINFSEGQFIPISFASWDGSNGEKGSRHELTSWYWLLLPPEESALYVLGLPAAAGLLMLLVGLIFITRKRRPHR